MAVGALQRLTTYLLKSAGGFFSVFQNSLKTKEKRWKNHKDHHDKNL
jgi:hypothetical protein